MGNTCKQGAILVATTFALAIVSPAAQSASPLAGNWKVAAVSEGKEITLLIIKVEDGDGKPTIKVLWPTAIKDTRLEEVAVDADSLRFTLRTRRRSAANGWPCAKGEEKPKQLLGSVHPPGNAEPLILARTDKTEIAQKDAEKDSPGFEDLRHCWKKRTPANRKTV